MGRVKGMEQRLILRKVQSRSQKKMEEKLAALQRKERAVNRSRRQTEKWESAKLKMSLKS